MPPLLGRLRDKLDPDRALGNGLWRRAYERTGRAVDRYHQVIEHVSAAAPRSELDEVGLDLAGLLPRVRAICAAANHEAPSEDLRVPAGPHGGHPALHRLLTQVGTAIAQTSEAAMMVRVELDAVDPDGKRAVAQHEVDTALAAVRRGVVKAAALVGEVEILGGSAEASGGEAEPPNAPERNG